MLTTKILDPSGFKQILVKYQQSLQSLRNWNIDIPEDSRLYCYEKAIKHLADKGVGNNPSHLCDLMFYIIEVDEINDIVLNEGNTLPDNETIEKLTDMVKGSEVKNIDEESQPRSSQFELYMKALLNISGLECNFKPTQSGETPDLTVKLDNENFDLEVKRPLSPKNIHRNTVKKASSQLDAENPGILILSLDHILLGNHNVVTLEDGDAIDDSLALLETETTKWLNENKRKLMNRFKLDKSICALLLIIKSPVFLGSLNKMAFANHLRLVKLQGFSKDNSRHVETISNSLDVVWGNEI